MDNSKALVLVDKMLTFAVNGAGPLVGSEDLAQQYLRDHSYGCLSDRVNGLIRWETSKNTATGAVTGLGGLLTLPIAIPGALGSSWAVQTRLAGAVAVLRGHSLRNDRVRTAVVMALLGNGIQETLKNAGIQIGQKVALQALKKLPGRMLIAINKAVGFRLLTKAGEKGVINLIKAVPLLGGVIGGSIDGAACYAVGRAADSIFSTA